MDIADWLANLGLGKYASTFAANEITPDALPHLSEADLKDLGLPLGPRRIILAAIEELAKKQANFTSSGAAAVARPEAERRQLTLMFVDLVGSTAMSGELDPEDMATVIRAYQTLVAAEIARVEGHVAKFMGDGVLAYFGWPRAHENEAERAVRAALAIAREVPELTTPANEAPRRSHRGRNGSGDGGRSCWARQCGARTGRRRRSAELGLAPSGACRTRNGDRGRLDETAHRRIVRGDRPWRSRAKGLRQFGPGLEGNR